MRAILTASLLLGLLVSLCNCETADGFIDGSRVWVSIDPVQCGGNPWNPPGLTPEEYYRGLGIDVTASATIRVFDVVCAACSCPTGDRVYLNIGEQSLDFMLGEGFVLSPGPPT